MADDAFSDGFQPGAFQGAPYIYTATGGITAGGVAATCKTKAFLATGGATSGGVAAVNKLKVFTASGGATAGGAAALLKLKVFLASGGMTSGGVADTDFVDASAGGSEVQRRVTWAKFHRSWAA